MKILLIRIVCIVLVFGSIFVHAWQNGYSMATVLLMGSGVLIFYFLAPIAKFPLMHYLLAIVFVAIGSISFNTPHLLYWMPLYGFLMLESVFLLKEKAFFLFIGLTAAVLFITAFLNQYPMFMMLLLSTIIISCIILHHYMDQVNSKSVVLDEILTQYRQLKRLSVEQEQFVRAEERTKIARDIHDSVGHKLTSLLMQLEMMSIRQNTESLLQAKELARDSLEETRYAVRQLKSSNTSGIQSVLQLIRKLEMESRLHIRFTLEKGVLTCPLTNEQSVVLYRVLQESLTNAMKHSQSKEVEVILGVNSIQHIQFEVTNKIIGDTPIIQGFGLTSMQERLQEIGGELRIIRTEQHFTLNGFFPINH
ncbi:sensor histidine kinase [Lysinibacillus yapensis]|uniref:histidine kinase n=1 Tax=Ureibacillus yapensis TaxID=2304605 RepID=A0A396SBP7_9BACL|nr:sensor histidine kinase [Lysinibacillus yapensis]RHW38523.1 sensor histidine kinase [Lysinibacillus yapensis]